mgnify:FL=1
MSRRYNIELINNETGTKKNVKVFKMSFAEAASCAYLEESKGDPGKYRVTSVTELGKLERYLNL